MAALRRHLDDRRQPPPYPKQSAWEFYEHVREHIAPERRLTCPACTFVTEFRHHFKYHVMTHLNAKPYRCVHARCQT